MHELTLDSALNMIRTGHISDAKIICGILLTVQWLKSSEHE